MFTGFAQVAMGYQKLPIEILEMLVDLSYHQMKLKSI